MITVVLAGWLAACGTVPGPVSTTASTRPDMATAPSPTGPLPTSQARAALPSPVASAASRDVAAKVAALVNLTRDDLTATFGQPDFTRADPPAEIWQYRSASCVLDVFFYPEGSDMRVSYAATHSRGLIKIAENACFPGLATPPRPVTTEARS
ncbi:MAG TPA: hypothetical protein VNT30_18725 [Stellaceae bacterium]|nr:hypothetical protein [Stellaceae bacterium]